MDRFSYNTNNNNNNNSPANSQRLHTNGAELDDITNGLEQMNVDLDTTQQSTLYDHQISTAADAAAAATTTTNNNNNNHQYFSPSLIFSPNQLTSHHEQTNNINIEPNNYYQFTHNNSNTESKIDADYGEEMGVEMLISQENNFQSQPPQQHHQQQQQLQQQEDNNILIVTNVDPNIFNDKLLQAKFESLFTAFDPNVTFRYLKSFRRVRLDFTNSTKAYAARSNLSQYTLGNTQFKCFTAQIIRPNYPTSDNTMCNSNHLNVPKLTKQFLISPPASPPEGWEPIIESSPVIDVQLISAIANLVPGSVHEIHPASESHPGIYVEVCEEPQYVSETSAMQQSCSRIPRTMSPANFTRLPPL